MSEPAGQPLEVDIWGDDPTVPGVQSCEPVEPLDLLRFRTASVTLDLDSDNRRTTKGNEVGPADRGSPGSPSMTRS